MSRVGVRLIVIHFSVRLIIRLDVYLDGVQFILISDFDLNNL